MATSLDSQSDNIAAGTLADVLVALGLIERLTDLIDIRKDDLGLALASEHVPQRGRSFATTLRKQRRQDEEPLKSAADTVDPDGVGF